MKKFTIGVDVGGTNIKLGLINPSGKIMDRGIVPTEEIAKNKNRMVKGIADAIQDLIKNNDLTTKNIDGVGFGLPGLIDPIAGIVKILPNISGWRNVPFKKIMSKEIGLPVFIDNDVNVITLAEWKYGAGKGCKNLVCITLGTGVGGGLILNNDLYRGEGFTAGEMGHIPVGDTILENLVGNGQLRARAAKTFKNKNITLEETYKLAGLGNIPAKELWEDAGVVLGTVLAGIVNVLNPRLIIIGGGVSNNFKYFGSAVRQTIKSRAMRVPEQMVKVVRAKLGDDAGILGAQILVKGAA